MKTMKFLSMAALALVGAMTVSCSSDNDIIDQPQQPETKNNVVTLTTTVGFDEGAGTTRALDIDYSAHTLTKTFAVGDQIALIYTQTGSTTAKAVSATLTAGDISGDGKSANFTFELTDPKSGIVRYIYPAALAGATDVDYSKLASQDGTLASIASTLDYAGTTKVWSGDALPTANLTNQFAIIAYTLKDATGANDITSTITGMTISDGMNNYTINGVDPDGHIYAAIRIMNNANIEYTATDGTKNYTKSVTGKSYTPGEFYQVGLRMAEAVKPDLLSGVFSVSDSKTVKFSKGNLRYASGTWSFFDNQYDYYTSYSADAWDHFGWSTSATTYGMNTSTGNSTYSGDFVDWGNNSALQTALGTGWFTLSSAEWTYLFNERSASTVGGTANGRYAKAKVNNVQGVILYPDTYTHPDGVTAPTNVNTDNASFDSNTYTIADWTKMESAGCVFLPAAGHRNGSSVKYAGTYGGYWSATPDDTGDAYFVDFSSSYLDPAYYDGRSVGYSVRLVHDAN